ncbi:SAM-dependent methyltransferase [Frankia sp. R82]|uniref:SAM-dependent methyltransferase n=1 Tax=Frankia sp. R82 TaxID=2950553 RepID=UPI002043A7A5|nr:SAM-dependent methyltransferase [Frankia sp. R82]MCM3884318.1 SAM-dependent methyltransferase [Frankia sp. R82]
MLAHARARLVGSPEGRTTCLHADLRDPARILAAPELTETLDLTRPVALCLIAVLHFLEGDEPFEIVRTLLDPLPAGSFLVISHGTNDLNADSHEATAKIRQSGVRLQPRSRAEIARFFDGLTILDPGIEVVHRWRPEVEPTLADGEISIFGAVART